MNGFPPQAGAPNPLALHPFVLLRTSYGDALTVAGIPVPEGASPYKLVGQACGMQTPNCQPMMNAIKARVASAVRADASGNGTFPGVPPGTYYLMISAAVNNKPLVWGQAVQLKPGANSFTLSPANATPIQ